MLDSVLKVFGVKPPVVLDRLQGAFPDHPFEGRRAAATGILRPIVAQGRAAEPPDGPYDILAFDATGITDAAGMRALYDFFHPRMRQVAHNARIVVVTGQASTPEAAAAARGVEGFVRTLAKEVGGRGATANLVAGCIDPAALEGPVRFLCSAASTYVSGQVFHLGGGVQPPSDLSMQGKLALVTGAARGIGAATAARLAREGAEVVALDVPAAAAELEKTCAAIGARALALDMAGEGAAAVLAGHFPDGIDIVVHNAGITRDRTLGKMDAAEWDKVIAINLSAILDANASLRFRPGARIVCLSSTSGIAGNFGQANYAASKAALIGYVAAAAPGFAAQGITINAVAPGFIETPMTGRMPFLPREIGRRVNSLKQGGQPEDVAQLVAFLSSPGSYGITGNTIRVCGQSVMGA